MRKLFLLIFAISASLLWQISCGSSIGLDLYMTSENAGVLLGNGNEDVSNIVVTLTGLEVHQTSAGQESGWASLTVPSGSFDLMDINDVERLISSTEITAGSYNQIRFFVNTARVTTTSGTYDAEVPSQKINVAVQFEIKDGDVTEVVLSWDAEASLNKTGQNPPQYTLQPVIHVQRVKNPTAVW